jgi:small-conductance mechanosensitive channel
VPRLWPGPPLWVRLVWRVSLLAALTWLVQGILVSPLNPQFRTLHSGERLWQELIEAGWWIVGAQVVAALVRLLVVLENRPRETQIISDLLAGVIYVATTLAIVNFAFEVPIGGLLATSGVIAIILGPAGQEFYSALLGTR